MEKANELSPGHSKGKDQHRDLHRGLEMRAQVLRKANVSAGGMGPAQTSILPSSSVPTPHLSGSCSVKRAVLLRWWPSTQFTWDSNMSLSEFLSSGLSSLSVSQ